MGQLIVADTLLNYLNSYLIANEVIYIIVLKSRKLKLTIKTVGFLLMSTQAFLTFLRLKKRGH